MTQEQIEQGNKLIAEFMEYMRVYPKNNYYARPEFCIEFNPNQDEIISLNDAKFHSSWDWLMPVVEKIESLNYSVTIGTSFGKDESQRTYCEINQPESWNFSLLLPDEYDIACFDQKNGNSKITNVYLAVIEFVKWHNANKKY
jgi:hypothetical protein